MFPYVMAIFGALMLVHNSAVVSPRDARDAVRIQNEALVTQLLQVHRSSTKYFNANPVFAGMVADADIMANMLPGSILPANVDSLVSGGNLFTYTTDVAPVGSIVVMGRYTTCSELSGTVEAGSTLLPSCRTSGGVGTVPGVIPVGSLITVGH